MHRGQIVTVDFIFALSIAVALMLAMNIQWTVLNGNIENYENSVPIEMAAQQASMYLVNGRGYPADWNSTNVQLLGLVDDQLNVVEQYKLDELMKIANSSLGQLLGVPGYNVFINITTVTGETRASTGLRPENYSVYSQAMNYVGYDRMLTKLYVVLWK